MGSSVEAAQGSPRHVMKANLGQHMRDAPRVMPREGEREREIKALLLLFKKKICSEDCVSPGMMITTVLAPSEKHTYKVAGRGPRTTILKGLWGHTARQVSSILFFFLFSMCVYAARAEISLPLTAVTAGGMDRSSLIPTRTKAESPKIADITAIYCKKKKKISSLCRYFLYTLLKPHS